MFQNVKFTLKFQSWSISRKTNRKKCQFMVGQQSDTFWQQLGNPASINHPQENSFTTKRTEIKRQQSLLKNLNKIMFMLKCTESPQCQSCNLTSRGNHTYNKILVTFIQCTTRIQDTPNMFLKIVVNCSQVKPFQNQPKNFFKHLKFALSFLSIFPILKNAVHIATNANFLRNFHTIYYLQKQQKPKEYYILIKHHHIFN
eukprot:TRINITY_DN4728_c0_g1_i2.p3 TRINITY_DN4728_c0_g1~~TRINITY_DN4728_c0_g1_i2.p3  ORF type:complete len:200 (+),score=-13.13 TRINITY_DN4728_c0_g1_i2:405-1004(+)